MAFTTLKDLGIKSPFKDKYDNFIGGKWVKPVDGKYFLQSDCRIDNLDTASTYYILYIVTSNRTSQIIIDPNFTADLIFFNLSISGVFDMDAGDAAYINIRQDTGHNSSHVSGSNYTNFSGYLLG